MANRCLAPSSKLACCTWATDHALLPGVPAFSEDDAYRGMDALLAAEEEIASEVWAQVATLLNLEVDLLFFDTTSTWFEIEEEDGDDGLRRFGHSKDHREDRPQVGPLA